MRYKGKGMKTPAESLPPQGKELFHPCLLYRLRRKGLSLINTHHPNENFRRPLQLQMASAATYAHNWANGYWMQGKETV